MQIKDILQKIKIDRREAELIVAHVLGKPREFILVHPEHKINSFKVHKVIKFIKLRENNVPLAYITSHKEFCGLDFIVNKHTLIPRPDTELIVQLVLQELRTKHSELGTTLVDVGTGSGCIPISILKAMADVVPPRGGCRGMFTYAIDISKPALSIARKNAKNHHAKIKFLHGNLLSKFPISNFPLSLPFDALRSPQALEESSGRRQSSLIITANLPYLTPEQFESEPSIQHEPKSALVAGKDGLKYYRQLLKQIANIVRYQMLDVRCYIEIDPSQSTSIKKLIKQYLPKATIEIHKDWSGYNRVVVFSI